MKETIGVGRRKTAVASVRLRKGKGKFDVNGRTLEEYFFNQFQRQIVISPLQKIDCLGKYDLVIRVKGGGVDAQAMATRLGLSRALVKLNEELKVDFKELGYLTRDPRMKERKKYGRAGARKRFQFSKR